MDTAVLPIGAADLPQEERRTKKKREEKMAIISNLLLALCVLLEISIISMVIVEVAKTNMKVITPMTQMIVLNKKKEPGNHGRFRIPELGINVGLNDTTEDKNAQDMVDELDSAVYFPVRGDHVFIVDHGVFPFSNIRKAVPGKTKAYITDCDQPETFLCKKLEDGYLMENTQPNGRRDLFGSDDVRVKDKEEGTMVTYCCTSSTDKNGITNVQIVYWDRIGSDKSGNAAGKLG